MIFGLLVARSTFHSISIKFLLKMDDFGAPPEDTVECLALAKTTKPQPQPQPQPQGGGGTPRPPMVWFPGLAAPPPNGMVMIFIEKLIKINDFH